ncbi:MAG: hypothetical protein AAFQ87_17740, partial [Bacteroidota bacterium]
NILGVHCFGEGPVSKGMKTISELLFPPFEQRLIAEHIPDAQYVGVDSTKGHDGFLIEIPEIAAHIQNFLE